MRLDECLQKYKNAPTSKGTVASMRGLATPNAWRPTAAVGGGAHVRLVAASAPAPRTAAACTAAPGISATE